MRYKVYAKLENEYELVGETNSPVIAGKIKRRYEEPSYIERHGFAEVR